MARLSAGILPYRRRAGEIEVLLVHPGGPYFARRDDGWWSIPKGEYSYNDDPWGAALREFREELGVEPPTGELAELGEVVQASGKRVLAWALCCEVDADNVVSNTFELEWPPGSGKHRVYPEVDRAAWFDLTTAAKKLLPAQVPLLERLESALRTSP